MATAYQVYNAALANGWTVREAAAEFGITSADAKALIIQAGGRVSSRGAVA